MAAPAAAASVNRGGGSEQQHHHHNQQHQHSNLGGSAGQNQTSSASEQSKASSDATSENSSDYRQGHGHFFTKKNFHRPTHCHHCMEMVWGLLGQGYVCEVCNFVCHDRCLKTVISSCTSIAYSTLKNPVPHCWSEPGHFKRKFCYVCRKRLDDNLGVRCEICEYYVHVDCQDFVVVNCKDCATYVPNKDLPSVRNYHHWREGNLPGNSKCIRCKKTCWSSEYLTGMRCEWCGATAHPACFTKFTEECDFGCLGSIMLPPSSVSIPRSDLPMEAIIGIQTRRKEAMSPRSISDEFSSTGDLKSKDNDENQVSTSSKDKERDEEAIKVYDGNSSMRRRMFRIITVSRNASRDDILSAALRSFHIADDPSYYYVTDAYSSEEVELLATNPITALTRYENRRPATFLRFYNAESDSGQIRVYPGRLRVAEVYKILHVTNRSTVDDVIVAALDKFGLDSCESNLYKLTQVTLEKGTVHERTMDKDELPWEILKNIGKESIRQMEMTRFYLQQQEDPHGSNIALFVGNLPSKLSQRQYEKILIDIVGKENKFDSIGPIYYEYGSLIITFTNCETATKVFYLLRESSFEDKNLLVLLLPNVMQDMIPEGVRPLLIFVNVKSGGCQGQELISSFRKLLNPYQVFDLENGGPLPGLYVFRFIKDYKILACGGDGTVGWVLQCLDNVGQDSVCQSPPCAIVPLGTGNDLARVLRWGPGFTGCEDPLTILKDIIDAEEIRLDRWTVVFHFEEKPEDKPSFAQTGSGSTSEDNTAIFVMNNYFGIGIDADLCLDFHNAREENPNKFNSRLRNKGVYVKMGLRKMVSRKSWKDLHKEVRLEVDGKVVELPPVEGIIILNILSWGSGANPWGPEREDQFAKPTHYDGMLEVVGVTGVVHMGQILSGMRSAIRIAQGGHLRIRLNTDMPVQVDGEPWVQSPGEVVVLRSALKATMLKKNKVKRRDNEPSILASPSE